MPTPECKHCGLLKSTIEACDPTDCTHDFGNQVSQHRLCPAINDKEIEEIVEGLRKNTRAYGLHLGYKNKLDELLYDFRHALKSYGDQRAEEERRKCKEISDKARQVGYANGYKQGKFDAEMDSQELDTKNKDD